MTNPNQPKNRMPQKSSLTNQRTQAKVGMALAMGTLVATGFMAHMFEKEKAGIAHITHIAAGVSLVGFSYWHWKLYQPSSGKGRSHG